MDDYIPCALNNGELVFAKTRDQNIWLSIIEKAWAKIHGTYERTISGCMLDPLRILTGTPAFWVNIES